jgi:hypothetical protein
VKVVGGEGLDFLGGFVEGGAAWALWDLLYNKFGSGRIREEGREGRTEQRSGGTKRWCVPFSEHIPLLGGVEECREQHVDCKAVMRYQRLAQITLSLVVVGRIHDVTVS